jgi:alkylation response protein AidB-like acyl-CoA dehydrogenase
MNFDFTDDQQAIAETAKQFLAARSGAELVRRHAEAGTSDDALWQEIVGLGWPGIAIDERHGGLGLSLVELTILQEELGRVLAPVPFFATTAAALVIQAAGDEEQQARWLPGLADGSLRGALGIAGAGGTAIVPDAPGADLVVLVEGDRARVVEGARAEVRLQESIDPTRRYATVVPEGGEMLAGSAARGVDQATVALAAELTGVAQTGMEMATEYARERQQFGRPIGVFQGVSHRCAQMLLEVEGARSTTYYAAWAADGDPASLALATSVAKASASKAAWSVTASSLQVHGGIGFTWEHSLHFFLKRARAGGALFGTVREHNERVARLAGLDALQAA